MSAADDGKTITTTFRVAEDRTFADDNEDAFERALGISSAEFDARLLRWIESDKLRGMQLVPRFDDNAVHRLLMRVAKDPDEIQARIDLAWAFMQRGNPVDAGPHLAFALQQQPKAAFQSAVKTVGISVSHVRMAKPRFTTSPHCLKNNTPRSLRRH